MTWLINDKGPTIYLFGVVHIIRNRARSKNVFVLVVAHLEPELELFKVKGIVDDGNDDL